MLVLVNTHRRHFSIRFLSSEPKAADSLLTCAGFHKRASQPYKRRSPYKGCAAVASAAPWEDPRCNKKRQTERCVKCLQVDPANQDGGSKMRDEQTRISCTSSPVASRRGTSAHWQIRLARSRDRPEMRLCGIRGGGSRIPWGAPGVAGSRLPGSPLKPGRCRLCRRCRRR